MQTYHKTPNRDFRALNPSLQKKKKKDRERERKKERKTPKIKRCGVLNLLIMKAKSSRKHNMCKTLQSSKPAH